VIFTAITIALGAVAMFLAVLRTTKLRNLLLSGPNVKKWQTLIVLMVFFLAGYLLSIWLVLANHVDLLLMVTGVVFFMGAVFVLLVVNTAKSDVLDIRKTKEVLREKNDRLEKMNTELDLFAHRVSHDLKAPIASIRGLINLAEHAGPSPEVALYLSKMKESTLSADSFIRDVLDLSKNASRIVIQKTDVQKMTQEIIDNLRYIDPEQKTEIVLMGQDAVINTDPVRLRIILTNLISNAYKYHDQQKEKSRIEINLFKEKDALHVSVKDNGIGIGDEHLEKIFDMFYRATSHSKGTGLGLYVVKEMVEKLNGTIQVKSTKDKGSEFIVKIAG
jgi:signal transduction histidine kinase